VRIDVSVPGDTVVVSHAPSLRGLPEAIYNIDVKVN
jgi:hypothetical protein